MMPATTAMKGSVWKQAVCPRCGHEYQYLMSRTGTGSYSGFAWTEAEGRDKAAPEAESDLRHRLANDVDVVPCPKCGAITAEMADEEQTSTSIAWLVIVLGVPLFGGGLIIFEHFPLARVWFWCLLLLGGGFFMTAGGIVTVCSIAQERKQRQAKSQLSPDGKTTMPSQPDAAPPVKEDRRAFCDFFPDPQMRHQRHMDFAHRFLPARIHQQPGALFGAQLSPDATDQCFAGLQRSLQEIWADFERAAGLAGPGSAASSNPPPSRWITDLRASPQVIAGRPAVLIEMPPSENPLAAVYIAVVLAGPLSEPGSMPGAARVRYFTLEREFSLEPGGAGLLCEWTPDGTHHNFGLALPFIREAMIEVVAEILK